MAFTTDDLATWRAEKSPPAGPAVDEPRTRDSAQAIQFSLRELLIAVTVIAGLLGLLRAAGIFGAVLAFVATAGFTWILYPKMKPRDLRGQQAMFDFLWGVGMPLICLVFDPFLFKESDDLRPFAVATSLNDARIYDHGFIVYAFLVCQMIVLTVSIILGNRAGRWSSIFGGFLVSGLLFAALVALVLVIPAAFGVFFLGIGLLGLTPIVTMFSYGRQCHRALSNNWQSPTKAVAAPLAVLGLLSSIVGPVMIGLGLLAALRGPEAVARLLSG